MAQDRQIARSMTVAAVASGGTVVFAVAVPGSFLPALAVAVVVGAAIELHSAHLRVGIGASLVNVAILTAVVLLGSAGAIAVAAGAAFGGWHKYPTGSRARLERAAFNFGQWALGAAAAAAVFRELAGAAPPVGPGLLLPLLSAAVVFTATNVALMTVIVWVDAGERPRSVLGSLGPIVLMQPAFVAYALVAVALIDIHPLALALLAVPMLLSRSAYAAFAELTEATESLLRTLITLIEQRDGYTRGHAERVADLAVMLARDLGYSHDDVQTVRQAALLHDIGKICVPLDIIRKPGRLTRDEFEEIRRHPGIGARVLGDVEALQPALPGIRHHHERVDGGGYPDGLAGDAIPELVRVVSIADAFDAMTSTRSYRKALPVPEALGRLTDAAGTQFDATLVQRFIQLVDRHGWEPTIAPAAAWPADAEVEPLDNCCAPTLAEQFGGSRAPRSVVMEGTGG